MDFKALPDLNRLSVATFAEQLYAAEEPRLRSFTEARAAQLDKAEALKQKLAKMRQAVGLAIVPLEANRQAVAHKAVALQRLQIQVKEIEEQSQELQRQSQAAKQQWAVVKLLLRTPSPRSLKIKRDQLLPALQERQAAQRQTEQELRALERQLALQEQQNLAAEKVALETIQNCEKERLQALAHAEKLSQEIHELFKKLEARFTEGLRTWMSLNGSDDDSRRTGEVQQLTKKIFAVLADCYVHVLCGSTSSREFHKKVAFLKSKQELLTPLFAQRTQLITAWHAREAQRQKCANALQQMQQSLLEAESRDAKSVLHEPTEMRPLSQALAQKRLEIRRTIEKTLALPQHAEYASFFALHQAVLQLEKPLQELYQAHAERWQQWQVAQAEVAKSKAQIAVEQAQVLQQRHAQQERQRAHAQVELEAINMQVMRDYNQLLAQLHRCHSAVVHADYHDHVGKLEPLRQKLRDSRTQWQQAVIAWEEAEFARQTHLKELESESRPLAGYVAQWRAQQATAPNQIERQRLQALIEEGARLERASQSMVQRLGHAEFQRALLQWRKEFIAFETRRAEDQRLQTNFATLQHALQQSSAAAAAARVEATPPLRSMESTTQERRKQLLAMLRQPTVVAQPSFMRKYVLGAPLFLFRAVWGLCKWSGMQLWRGCAAIRRLRS